MDGDTASRRPIVSIVCHTFNHAAYIEETFRGIANQETSSPFEVIVHDDASTDGAQEVIRRWRADHPGVFRCILQETNQLSRGQRIPGITYPMVRGDYVALCEGDDYWCDPTKLERQLRALRENPGVDLCLHPGRLIGPGGRKGRVAFWHGRRETIYDADRVVSSRGQFAPTASLLFRARVIDRLPRWFFEDPRVPHGDYFVESVGASNGALYIPQVMSVYRRGIPGSYTVRSRVHHPYVQERRMRRMTVFVSQLKECDSIPDGAVDKKVSNVLVNYAINFCLFGDRRRIERIIRRPEWQPGVGARLLFWIAARNTVCCRFLASILSWLRGRYG